MSVVPWNDIGDTSVIDIGDKIGVFKTSGVTAADKFKLLLLSQVRSTPQNTHYVKNQAELEDALGPDLIIPTSTAVTIVIDQSFVTTKPFKKQAGSSLLLKSESSSVTLTFIGPGALIQMDGAVVGDRTIIKDITLSGNTINNCFAIDDLSFVIVSFCVLQGFVKIGFFENTAVSWMGTVGFANKGGMDFINCRAVALSGGGGDDLNSSPQQTMFSFVGDAVATSIIFENTAYFATDVQSELLFIDPNMPPGSFFTVTASGIITVLDESLFQRGVDVAVTAVADNTGGKIRCTSVSHGQVNGTYAVLSGFPEPTYNKTALITVIDNDTFDVLDIDFLTDEVGTINRASRNSTSPEVSALQNPNQRDSMFIASAGLETFDSPVVSATLATGETQVITSTSWQFNKLERFEIGVANEGEVICKDLSIREYSVKYTGTIEKAGGSSGNIGLVLLKNGVEIAFNPPHTVNTGLIQITGDDLIELTENDAIKVIVKNYDGSTAVINTHQVSLVISKG